MALQIRRGLETDRAAVTPALGELLYTTDEKLIYVGDGTTAGGNLLAGGGAGGLANVVEDTSPQLGGNLDVNGFSIVSATDTNININPGGNGDIVLHDNLIIDTFGNFSKTGQLNISSTGVTSFGSKSNLVDGNIFITRDTYSAVNGAGFTFAQHHDTANAVNFTFYRSRGTGLVSTAVVSGDRIGNIAFAAHDGTPTASPGAQISAVVDGTPVVGNVPTKLSFITNNGTTTAGRAEISAAGVLKSNSIQNFTGTNLNITGTGTVSAINSIIGNGTASPAAGTILTVNGTVTGGTFAVGNIINGGTTSFGTAITAVNSATFTATINTTTMTVSNVAAGTLTVGMAISGGSVTAGTYVVAFVSGVNGGAGIYTLNQSATGTPTTGRSYTVSASQLVKSTTIATGGNVNLVGNVKLLGQNSLRFADADSSNYVAFKAPATVAADVTWTLPATDGSAGQVLSTNGIGTLSWATSGAGSGLVSRTTVSETTASLANGATDNISIVGAKGYVLYKIQTSVAAWVRIYTTTAARTADSSRAEGIDPLPGAGVLAEVITTGAAITIMSPGVLGFNDEALPTQVIALAVTNKSGSTSVVTVTLTILQVEA